MVRMEMTSINKVEKKEANPIMQLVSVDVLSPPTL